MLRRIGLVLGAVMLVGIMVGQSFSADSNQQPQPRPTRGGMRGDPAQFRTRMMERIKEDLKVTDDEWKVMEPKIEKVQTLQMQTRAGRGRFGMRGPQGQESERPTSNVEKKADELQKLLADQSAKPEAIKAALKALRDARETAKADLAKAQKDLREVLNLRQESQLVLTGILE